MSPQSPASLILASTSRYRRELLGRLSLAFDVEAPRVDETAQPGEMPIELAQRLALAKARDVSERHPTAVVVGSDQVADLDGRAVGKPGSHERAVAQLRSMSNRVVRFHTAVAVTRVSPTFRATLLSTVTVRFRDLSDRDIENYLRREQPYDCAGSAKSEGLGIVLLQSIESDDPTALIGLPLIRTCDLLRQAGVDLLANP